MAYKSFRLSLRSNRARFHGRTFFGSERRKTTLPDAPSLPAAPRGYRAAIKREWNRLAKAVSDQGVDPNSRLDLLDCYIHVVAEENDLDLLWQDADLRGKLAIGRRWSTLLNAKLRIRGLLFAAEKEAKITCKINV
jgi:hypothetical protein